MENHVGDADGEPLPQAIAPISPLSLDSSAQLPVRISRSPSPLGRNFDEDELHALELTKEDLFMVLQNVVTVELTVAADDADVLAGTQLDQPGVPGVYTIWGCSTVGDTEMSVSLGGRTLTNAAILVLRANSEIRENEDTFFQVSSPTGGRPVINVNVVTAAVVRVRVKFLPAMALP